MKNIFTDHPKHIGESYATHFVNASYMGLMMLSGALTCLIHACFPFLFEKTASRILFKLTTHIIKRGLPNKDEEILKLRQLIAEKNEP